jgi:hypothetical protein
VTHDERKQNEKQTEVETTQKKLIEEAPKSLRKPSELMARTFLDAIEIRPSIFGIGINLSSAFRRQVKNGEVNVGQEVLEERRKSVEERKIEMVKQLLESNIDPNLFDVLLQNEVDRRLKVRFGVAFLILTFLFTTASYTIVILDGIYKWNISEVAITALIIETPIQFIGLLYIIARNLFPQSAGDNVKHGKRREQSIRN